MATTATLAHINWLARVWAPARLTDMGLTDLAASASGMQPINNAQRLNVASNWIAAREAEWWLSYDPAWSQWWEVASNAEVDAFWSQSDAAMLDDIFADSDVGVRAVLKSCLRLIELYRCRQMPAG